MYPEQLQNAPRRCGPGCIVRKSAELAFAIVFAFAGGLLCAESGPALSGSSEETAQPPLHGTPAAETVERPIHLDVPLVVVSVSAVDGQGRIVTGLHKQDFRIYEDGQPQRVSSLSGEDAPVSIALIFDASGSMAPKMDSARMAVSEFLRTANPADDFCAIGLSGHPWIISGFTSVTSELMARIGAVGAGGKTSLLDAIYLAVELMRHAKYSRRALVIFSDGGDNHSRYTERDLNRAIEESDVQIYALDIHGPRQRTFARETPLREELLGPELLENIAGITGGRSLPIWSFSDLPEAARKISEQLRNVYLLGYTPRQEKLDGKWHKIQVKVAAGTASGAIRVFAKAGYYAPQP